MSEKITGFIIAKLLLEALKERGFLTDSSVNNPFKIKHKKFSGAICLFSDDTKVLILIGNNGYNLNKKQREAVLSKFGDFFVISSHNGIQKKIPANLKDPPDIKDIVDKIEKAMSLL